MLKIKEAGAKPLGLGFSQSVACLGAWVILLRIH